MMLRLFAITAVVCVMFANAPARAASEALNPLRGEAKISLGKVINPDIIGGGVNLAHSDYLYIDYKTGAEWGDIHSQHLPYPDEADEWHNFNALMDYMGFQYVRLQVGATLWEPVNDNDNPHDLNAKDGFVFSPGFAAKHPEVDKNNTIYMDHMYRLLDHWEKRNLFVVLGNWWAGPSNFCPKSDNWMLARRNSEDPGEWRSRESMGVSNVEEFTESLAAIMYHLKKEKSYRCVEGISFWNEPELMTNYFGTLSGVYNSLGSQLRRLGIRDKVEIQAFDGGMFWNRENGHTQDQVARLLKLSGENMDILSFHDYNTTFDYRKNEPNTITISDLTIKGNVLPALEQSKAASRDGKPMMVVAGEYGSFPLCGPGDACGTPTYIQRLHNAEGLVQSLNHGCKAMAYWVYNCNMHAAWRMITFDENNKRHFVPDPTNYYPLAVAMKYIQRGSNIVQSEVTGFKDSNGFPRVFVTVAVKGEDITLLFVNDSDQPARVRINGINSDKAFKHWWVNSEAHDHITCAGEVKLTNGTELELKPLSITALTTYEYGSEKAQ